MMKRFTISLLLGLAIMLAGLWLSLNGQAQPQVPDELIALAQNLTDQAELALQEASLAWIAPTLDEVRASAQRMINILAGETGEGFDPAVENPGDGQGVVNYAAELKAELVGTPWEDFAVTADFVNAFSTWALEHAQAALAADDETQAREQIRRAVGFLRSALGCEDDLPTAGGARTILTTMQANNASNVVAALWDGFQR